jgi:hypothetical protein
MSGLQHRAWMLPNLPKGGVGVELGVFTGLFSEQIIRLAQPKRLYLVDMWWTKYGDLYPDWGPYTDYGMLPTRVAHDAAVARTAKLGTEVIVEVKSSTDWLANLPDQHLDWAYLDTSHQYADTWQELRALAPKIRETGFILGDDWQFSPDHVHGGVMLAINDFIRATDFDVRWAGGAGQWLIMRRSAQHRHDVKMAATRST